MFGGGSVSSSSIPGVGGTGIETPQHVRHNSVNLPPVREVSSGNESRMFSGDGGGYGNIKSEQRAQQQSAMADSAMQFLSTVKAAKKLKRREMMRKAMSARTVQSTTSSRANSTVSIPSEDFSSGLFKAASVANVEGGGTNGAALDESTPLVTARKRILSSIDGESNEDIADGEEAQEGETAPPFNEIQYEQQQITTKDALLEIVFGKGILSGLLLAGPVALVAVHYQWSPMWIFLLNFLTMIPLASILGDFTEEAALHTNETIGGLINATFGNAVEVVIGIQALLANEIRVVQASMLGSIFSNLLLVLGCCFFFGGLKHKQQHFNAIAATANMGLLALSSIALVLPTPFAEYYQLHDEHVLVVSRVAASFLLCMYIQLMIFQLHTHAYIFDEHNVDNKAKTNNSNTIDNDAGMDAGAVTLHDDHDDEEETPVMSFAVALLGLLLTTLLVALFSEFLVDSIDGFVQESGVSRTFVGIILLPIVGNAVEHITAVTVAVKNKMDLAMGVAIGSSTQISLFVLPLMVLAGWMCDKDMTLNFPHFELILYVMAVITVSIVLGNPSCNWLEGSLLITTYILIAVGFWFEKVQDF